jgi:hypothetical protein
MKWRVTVIVTAAIVVVLQSFAFAKFPTVKIIVSGPGLPTELPLVDKELLVNVFTSELFVGAAMEAPPAGWPRYSVAFVGQLAPHQQRVVYRLRYVPDRKNDSGYLYLPAPSEPDGQLNESTIIRPEDGHWTRASAAWSATLNAHLPLQPAK